MNDTSYVRRRPNLQFQTTLLKPLVGHDRSMLKRKAEQLKGTDAEGHAIANLLEIVLDECDPKEIIIK